MTTSWRVLATLALAGGLAVAVASAAVAAQPWPDALTGKMQQIKTAGVVKLGYRENAIPFSYLGSDNRPVGYSLDICHAIVAKIAEEVDEPTLGVEYVRVTAQNRFQRVVDGALDLECGSTTSTAERRAQVAFSPVIFVTGTRLAVPLASRVRSVDDLRARAVAVVRGTTNETAMHEVDRLRGLSMKFVTTEDYRDALALVEAGKADALAADEILLRGLLAETGRAGAFRIVGEMLSFEPYGIMYARGDPGLAEAVEAAMRSLAESREIVWLYNRWFVQPLPSGQRLDLPMNDQLRRSLELIGLPPD